MFLLMHFILTYELIHAFSFLTIESLEEGYGRKQRADPGV